MLCLRIVIDYADAIYWLNTEAVSYFTWNRCIFHESDYSYQQILKKFVFLQFVFMMLAASFKWQIKGIIFFLMAQFIKKVAWKLKYV